MMDIVDHAIHCVGEDAKAPMKLRCNFIDCAAFDIHQVALVQYVRTNSHATKVLTAA